MGHIKRKNLSESIVLVPSEIELEKMDDEISPLINKYIVNCNQILTLEKMRGTLLPKLMNGEIRVKYGKGEKFFAPTDKKEIL